VAISSLAADGENLLSMHVLPNDQIDNRDTHDEVTKSFPLR